MAHDHTPDSQLVSRALVGFIEEWTSNISCTVSEEENCVRDNFLGMARRVGSLEGEDHNESGVVRTREVVTNKSPCLVACIQKCEAKSAGYVWEQEEYNKVASCLLATGGDVIIEEYASENRYRDEHAVRNLHKSCDKSAEAESLDDYRSKVADTAVWNIAYKAKEKKQVKFRIFESFDDLVTLQMLIFDAGLIFTQSFDGPPTLFLAKHWSRNRGIRQEEE